MLDFAHAIDVEMTEDRFTALWNRCLLDGVSSNPKLIFEDLKRRYAEPHRHYHTEDHVRHCLQELDRVAHLAGDRDALEMAIWFHDAIYDPVADDNELQSAELFVSVADKRIRPALISKVYELILVTTHDSIPVSPDERVVVDIDLSSFGLDWSEFHADSLALREESCRRTDKEFYTAQLRFDRDLLARPTLFSTGFFRDRYEQKARSNVERRIRETVAMGYN